MKNRWANTGAQTAARKTRAAYLVCALAALTLLFVCPALAQPDKSVGLSVVLHHPDGREMARFDSGGSISFAGDGSLTASLALAAVNVDLPLVTGKATGQMQARLYAGRTILEKFSLTMPGTRLALADDHNATMDLSLEGSGSYDAATGTLVLDSAVLGLGRGLRLDCSGEYGPEVGLRAQVTVLARDVPRLKRALGPLWPEGVDMSGRPELVLTVASAPGREFRPGADGMDLVAGASLVRPVRVTVQGKAFDLPAFGSEARFLMGAENEGEWNATGSVDVRGAFVPGAVGIARPLISFDLCGCESLFDIRDLTLRTRGGLTVQDRAVPLDWVRLAARIVSGIDGGLRAEDVAVAMPGARLAGHASYTAEGRFDGRLDGSGMDLKRLAPVAQAMSGLPFADWFATGRMDISATAMTTDTSLNTETRVRFRDLGWMAPDGSTLAQGVGARAKLRSRLGLATLRRWVNAEVSVNTGEALWGTYYLNLADHPLWVSGNADQLGADRFKNLEAAIDWKGFGQVSATGDVWANGDFMDWRYRAEAEVWDVDLEAVFDSFVADPGGLMNFQGEHGLTGTAGFFLGLYSDGTTAELKGRFTAEDMGVTSADGTILVEGGGLDLPVSYRYKGEVVQLEEEQVPVDAWGRIEAAKVDTPWVKLDGHVTDMALVPNRFFIRGGLNYPLFGGEISLTGIRCDEPLSSRFKLGFDAALSRIDLSEFSSENVPVYGELAGNLGRVTLTRERLFVPGHLAGAFYGGQVMVHSIGVADPFEAHRQSGLELEVMGMDLELLSGALGVGRITGLVDLVAKDVVFAYNEPASLDISLRTSGEGDFEKTVSLKAVNSLSVVGTGSGIGDVGVGMFASFFEEFSYSGIGFQCILNNDRFQVRGLIREGGTEYLIKKPFFTGINVVNGNPNNFISFSDMIERVKRVVGKDSSGPVIE